MATPALADGRADPATHDALLAATLDLAEIIAVIALAWLLLGFLRAQGVVR